MRRVLSEKRAFGLPVLIDVIALLAMGVATHSEKPYRTVWRRLPSGEIVHYERYRNPMQRNDVGTHAGALSFSPYFWFVAPLEATALKLTQLRRKQPRSALARKRLRFPLPSGFRGI
jgi:hypothetical protein